MMHYWDLLWDWNNLDSVRAIHSFLEGWALVSFALLVLFDVLAHLSEHDHPVRARRLERTGLWFFGLAVFAEILAYPYSQRNDTLSEKLIGSLSKQSEKALQDSSTAIIQSGKATSAATSAEVTSATAVDRSAKAEGAASSALSLARGARQEADSFEADIKSAKAQSGEAKALASEAKSLLSEVRTLAAQAQERAAKAESGTTRLTDRFADRSLTDAQVQAIGDALRSFPGQEWDLTTYWDIPECMKISDRILAALRRARWTFIPPDGWRGLFGGVVGVLVYVHPAPPGSTVRLAADALVAALNNNGTPAQLRLQNAKDPATNRISLSVGTKN